MQLILSSKGQIVLPAPMRRRLRLKARARLEIEEREGGLFLRPAKPVKTVPPIDYPAPGSLKSGPRDYALDERYALESGPADL
jgi:AbrB family looped-hinge helix DNA binding protein